MLRVIREIGEMRAVLAAARAEGKSIGLVPTMGALHQGHLSLAARSVADNDTTVVSIFVNPLQFGPGEDFERYPRDLDGDCRLLAGAGVDWVFAVSAEAMYPEGFRTYVVQESLTERLCGRSRPGHFRGVTTVCTKLFNIVQPDRAYFGQKDYQQTVIIRHLLEDLNFAIQLVVLPTVREPDGLAMSSRNRYLTRDERRRATVLVQSLRLAQRLVTEGERRAAVVRKAMRSKIESCEGAAIDYVEIVDPETLEPLEEVTGPAVAAIAVWVGQVRLIDNEVLSVPGC
ncbi:MAG: pantoate--beta-alanine ligase [Planctomycetota bacterium]